MKRKRLIILLSISAALVLLILFLLLEALLFLASRAPDFYRRPLPWNPAEAAQLSDRFLQKSTLLAGDMRRPGAWHQVFTESEINAWLAVDFPKNYPHALPPGLSEPRVKIETDSLRVAAKARKGLLSGVVTAEVAVHLTEENTVVVVIRKLGLGLLPMPLRPAIERLKELATEAGWEIREMQKDGAPTFVITLPPHRDQKGHIVKLQILRLVDGRVELGGTVSKAGRPD